MVRTHLRQPRQRRPDTAASWDERAPATRPGHPQQAGPGLGRPLCACASARPGLEGHSLQRRQLPAEGLAGRARALQEDRCLDAARGEPIPTADRHVSVPFSFLPSSPSAPFHRTPLSLPSSLSLSFCGGGGKGAGRAGSEVGPAPSGATPHG